MFVSDARYQKNACRRNLTLTLTTIVATGHGNNMCKQISACCVGPLGAVECGYEQKELP